MIDQKIKIELTNLCKAAGNYAFRGMASDDPETERRYDEIMKYALLDFLGSILGITPSKSELNKMLKVIREEEEYK